MNMRIVKSRVNYLFIALFAISLVSCHNRKHENSTSLTGWSSKDKISRGFSDGTNYKGQQTPPGMVLIEGGTFTMGHVQDDVLFDWNTTPVDMQVRSFYMDETEVTNSEYLFYLEWLSQVYPSSEEQNKHIYKSALPDTLVWRHTLGANELLTENYLRHPSYADYPVVGVSWLQATNYCKWRSNIIAEKVLMDKGILNDIYSDDSLKVDGNNHFDIATYLVNPYALYEGDSSAYKKGLPVARKKGQERASRDEFSGRHVKISDGIVPTKFRLPSEAEWEYAAKAYVENREYNNIRGRKKYAWSGKYTRNKSTKFKGDQMANFKQGRGDYSGVAGWSNDGGDITMPIRSYDPNAYGLYDMSGNVAEWVSDVYRPIIDTDANDFNYYRGNVFTKPMIDEEGKVVIVDYETLEYDTLTNGKIIPKDLPGSVKYIPITKRDAYMRNNYEKSYNIDTRDGDLASTKLYDKDEDELAVKPRMYNSPITPSNIGESGLRIQEYDDQVRTTLISNESRVYKGGSWKDREFWLDPAQRRHLPEYMATSFIGFRCATDKLGPMTYDKRKRTTEKIR
ncbi:gliding motility lipoprotein GldJ [Urechidicola croceus]|uniref:Gliding motility lipoprotein GldJ n=2 Tax=Urechidicola croceus TaxID=1850246 RepID=A0A1D8PBS6_9FLAO|nr:gliding motility lipoprotein GldJ [Urechidicola croceus]